MISLPTRDDERAPRDEWATLAERVVAPVLERLAAGRLRAEMPLESTDRVTRADFSQLEAVARCLVGIAPWLELAADSGETRPLELARLATRGLARAADRRSSEAFNFDRGLQPLVDAAFLAQAFLRAPRALWHALDSVTQGQLVEGFRTTRAIPPYENNWWLFAAMIEAFLTSIGEEREAERLTTALQKHESWYLGDGTWGDGPEFHCDYYNSYVIQPMLTDVMEVIGIEPEWRAASEKIRSRTHRYAAIQERCIAPDGSFPAVGRSLTYRCGAFHSLAQSALLHRLPKSVPPARARRALTLVIRRTLNAPDTFDPAGWLRVGLSGHQPSLGEQYISTPSLYLCTGAFLPLGLPQSDPFWSDPEIPTTSELAWSGIDLPPDSAHE